MCSCFFCQRIHIGGLNITVLCIHWYFEFKVSYFTKRNIRKTLWPEELICSKNVRARASLRAASFTSATVCGSTIPDGMLSLRSGRFSIAFLPHSTQCCTTRCCLTIHPRQNRCRRRPTRRHGRLTYLRLGYAPKSSFRSSWILFTLTSVNWKILPLNLSCFYQKYFLNAWYHT